MEQSDKHDQKRIGHININHQTHSDSTNKTIFRKINNLPVSNWASRLKGIENNIEQNNTHEAYLKARELFMEFAQNLSDRWDLGSFNKGTKKQFIRNLRLVSPTLSSFFNKILNLLPESGTNYQNIDDILEIVYMLKLSLYSQMPKEAKNSKSQIEPDNKLISNNLLKDSLAENQINYNIRELTDSSPEIINRNHKIWTTLRKAILKFEYRSQT